MMTDIDLIRAALGMGTREESQYRPSPAEVLEAQIKFGNLVIRLARLEGVMTELRRVARFHGDCGCAMCCVLGTFDSGG